MVKDASGREGFSTGAIAKALETTPAAVKKALAELKVDSDFVKAGCAYYHAERIAQVKSALK